MRLYEAVGPEVPRGVHGVKEPAAPAVGGRLRVQLNQRVLRWCTGGLSLLDHQWGKKQEGIDSTAGRTACTASPEAYWLLLATEVPQEVWDTLQLEILILKSAVCSVL